MSKVIIYPVGDSIAVIHPCDCGLTIEQIAKKDVPTGLPYVILEDTELPDRSTRDAWQADFTTYNGVGE